MREKKEEKSDEKKEEIHKLTAYMASDVTVGKGPSAKVVSLLKKEVLRQEAKMKLPGKTSIQTMHTTVISPSQDHLHVIQHPRLLVKLHGTTTMIHGMRTTRNTPKTLTICRTTKIMEFPSHHFQ